VTPGEIVEATGWQKHTIRGFVSILGSNGGEKVESSKNAAGGAQLPHHEVVARPFLPTPLPVRAGAALLLATTISFKSRV
jgi:hypothetical protein